MKINSLNFKISILALFILALFSGSYGSFHYLTVRKVLYEELDNELKAKAQNVNNAIVSYLDILGSDQRSFRFAVHRVISQTGEHPHFNKIEKLEKLWVGQMYTLGLNRDTVGFFGPNGELLAHSPKLPPGFVSFSARNMQLAFKKHAFLENSTFGKKEFRIIMIPAIYKNEKKGVIVIGTSREKISRILSETRNMELLLIIFFLGVASALSQVFARSVLKPVNSIIQTTRKIDYKDLSLRIQTENVDKEMRDLVDTLNEMMSRLEKSFKYIAEFSSHVSHELKTPLAIIRGESELALKDDRLPEEYKRVIKDNLDEVVRMNKIITDLLLLTRLDFESHVFKFEKFDLIEFFKELEESIRLLADEKNIEIHTDFSQAPRHISGDKIHLRRLFFNLISNAIKFTSPGGKIRIRIVCKNDTIFVSVSDTGVGIPKEHLPKLFDKFFHFEGLSRGVHSGTGLGLALAQSIAKVHGGEIEVESVVGEGSTFTVRLPISN